MSEKDPKAKIVQLMKSAVEAPTTPKRPRKPSQSVKITGDHNHNIVGNGNVVAISPRMVHRTTVRTGEGVLDAQQKAELQVLVREWIDVRNAVRKSTFSFAAAWSALNKAFRVNSYHEIPSTSFEAAKAWLKRQTGIVVSMPSAKKLPNRRKKRVDAIKAACINQLGDERAYLAFIQAKFGADSLTELDDDQIEKVYRHVMRRKRTVQALAGQR